MNTKWGQEGGYSALCPNEYPAGCVAIAMAQIEKYHEISLNPWTGAVWLMIDRLLHLNL